MSKTFKTNRCNACCSGCFVKCPTIMAIVIFTITIFFIAYLAASLNLKLEGDISGDIKDERTQRYYAFTNAKDALDSNNDPVPQQSLSTYSLQVIYKDTSSSKNLVGETQLGQMRKIETKIIKVSDYSNYCVLVNNGTECSNTSSVIPALTVGTTEPNEKPSDWPLHTYGSEIDPDFNQVKNSLQEQYLNSSYLYGSDYSNTTQSGQYLRSFFEFGLPLKSYTNEFSDRDSQNDDYSTWLNDVVSVLDSYADEKNVEVVYGGDYAILAELNKLLAHDSYFSIGSVYFVFFYMWFATRSGFLASFGMLQILLSFPCALILYGVVFNIKFFSSLNILAIYIILAIGADDIFIFIDTWNHSRHQGSPINDSLLNRMKWTYPHAAKAMAITSATTAFAFLVTAINPIVEISSFGIFAFCLVTINYILVITLFPAIVVMYEKYYSHHHCCWCCACKRKIKGGFLSYEKEQNVCCSTCGTKACNKVCCCNCKRSDKLAMDWDGIDTQEFDDQKEPALFQKPDTLYEEDSDVEQEGKNKDENQEQIKSHENELFQTVKLNKKMDPSQMTRVERFLYLKFAPTITHKIFRWVLIVVFLVIFIVFVVAVAKMKPSDNEEQSLPDSSNFVRFLKYSTNNFPISIEQKSYVQVDVTWGLKGYDISNVNKFDPDSHGTVEWDNNFDLKPTQNQLWIESFCNKTAADPSIVSENDIQCVMVDFHQYRTDNNLSFPIPDGGNHEFGVALKTYLEGPGRNDFFQDVLFSKEGDVKLMTASFSSLLKMANNIPYTKLKPVYDDWQNYVNNQNGQAPYGVNSCFQTADGWWVWMNTQKIFIRSAITGSVSSIAVAFVVITLSTMNWRIGLLSTFTITCIVISVLGCMQLMGWALGVIESICATILAGLAVDYVVHFAHAVNSSKSKKRVKRVRDALYSVGVSIFSGCTTTIGASLFLFLCYIVFFIKFGKFVLLTVLFSFAYSFLFFLPLCTVLGPSGHGFKQGDLCRRKKQPGDKLREIEFDDQIEKLPEIESDEDTKADPDFNPQPALVGDDLQENDKL
ncbi:sterol-sensing domain [Anaeramoeba ignava]|uniref:Sterol-sensing domain n=1 Tax=Anaeramoeba ignava TaxID=1746090 RepID=A0A9Q0LJI7_ANAIG|nr:sterol-sensing domain [Anaeramoeba ignava]|eukprot:Anaeramoba_ignava/a479006_216.p1 GENE.a479006_216~~a479006_216.p1  ORF type:complete len:1074 (+),score=281.52 a479006_216:91-3222(+)